MGKALEWALGPGSPVEPEMQQHITAAVEASRNPPKGDLEEPGFVEEGLGITRQ